MHQHKLAFKILLMLRISSGRMEGWQGLQECHIKPRLGSYIHFCGVVGGWRLLRVSTSLLSKFYQCYVALAGWRGGRASKSAYQNEARQLHTLLWGSGRVEIATHPH